MKKILLVLLALIVTPLKADGWTPLSTIDSVITNRFGLVLIGLASGPIDTNIKTCSNNNRIYLQPSRESFVNGIDTTTFQNMLSIKSNNMNIRFYIRGCAEAGFSDENGTPFTYPIAHGFYIQ